MLVRYKNDHEKVAMGLLSFMPNEKDVKHLQHTMQAYNTNPNWHLYLWREDEKNIGAIGLRIEDNFEMVVQHISVDPSCRNMGVGRKMVDEIWLIYGSQYNIVSDDLTQLFLKKCISLDKMDHDNN